MIPDLPQSDRYLDTELWARLGPKVQEKWSRLANDVLAGKVKSLEDYREQIGILQGLRWVLDEAGNMNKDAD